MPPDTVAITRCWRRLRSTSGPYQGNVKWIPQRGARLARRDEGAYRQYSTEEQRRQVGCPARKALYIPLIRATSLMAVIDINTNPSRRDLLWFGLLLPVFFAVVGLLVWRRTGSPTLAIPAWAVGGTVSALFALWPASRRRMYVGWMYAVYPIGWTVSHLLLGIVYFAVITPIGLTLRMLHRDPLERPFDRAATTYWVRHDPARHIERYLRQF